jgi:hypothetical protein
MRGRPSSAGPPSLVSREEEKFVVERNPLSPRGFVIITLLLATVMLTYLLWRLLRNMPEGFERILN